VPSATKENPQEGAAPPAGSSVTDSGSPGQPRERPGGPSSPAAPRPDDLYALLGEHARDAILFVRREDGRILEANAAAAEAYGWTREELRALRVSDLQAEEPSPGGAGQTAGADDAGGLRFETVHRRKDGTIFPVEVGTSGAIAGDVRVLVSVVRDATPWRAMEAALRESEDRLALAMEAAGLGMFHAVPYGPLQLSPRCREIFGVGDEPIPDFEAFLRHVHPADREQVREAAAKWLDPAGDGRYKEQYRWLRPDGTVRWVAASGIVRLKKVGDVRVPVQLVGTIFDITDQKLAQEQLMLNDRLASVGMLAAGVAHEINSPLSYLMGALEFLDEQRSGGAATGAGTEAAQALAEAREGAQRVRQVVRDLKALSGTREERPAHLKLQTIAESAIRLATSEIQPRARLEREYRDAPEVVGDEARLGQVVLNLIVNAAHAIPEGRSAENEIRVVIGTDASGGALLEVRDTGAGIPPELAGRIFDPFFTTKPRGVGTGLGLAICRSIVVGMGGEITVVPGHGGGTTMRVLLPAAPPGTEVASSPRAAGTSSVRATRRGRVLVVDDEPAVGLTVRRLLASEHDVELRTRAEDALEAISRGERFDAILCDLMMPGMKGWELHAALEQVAPDQARRMVVLTGGAFTESAREFLGRVPLPRIEKPFDAAILRERLGALLT
jgi:PAS domain S-box-containing protein